MPHVTRLVTDKRAIALAYLGDANKLALVHMGGVDCYAQCPRTPCMQAAAWDGCCHPVWFQYVAAAGVQGARHQGFCQQQLKQLS